MSSDQYHEFLDSLKWSIKTDQVRRRAKGCCEWCGIHETDKRHHTHHTNYKKGLDCDIAWLALLCFKCHSLLVPSTQAHKLFLERKGNDSSYLGEKMNALIVELWKLERKAQDRVNECLLKIEENTESAAALTVDLTYARDLLDGINRYVRSSSSGEEMEMEELRGKDRIEDYHI